MVYFKKLKACSIGLFVTPHLKSSDSKAPEYFPRDFCSAIGKGGGLRLRWKTQQSWPNYAWNWIFTHPFSTCWMRHLFHVQFNRNNAWFLCKCSVATAAYLPTLLKYSITSILLRSCLSKTMPDCTTNCSGVPFTDTYWLKLGYGKVIAFIVLCGKWNIICALIPTCLN